MPFAHAPENQDANNENAATTAATRLYDSIQLVANAVAGLRPSCPEPRRDDVLRHNLEFQRMIRNTGLERHRDQPALPVIPDDGASVSATDGLEELLNNVDDIDDDDEDDDDDDDDDEDDVGGIDSIDDLDDNAFHDDAGDDGLDDDGGDASNLDNGHASN